MVGIVSEGDLLHRAEIGTGRRTKRQRSWWLEAIKSGRDAGFRDYVKSHGRTVENVMTRDVISVSETTELADIATLLETKGIKRVPVVRDGQLVGIISRSNLVRALTATKRDAATKADVHDAAIRHELLAEVARQKWNHVHAEDIVVNVLFDASNACDILGGDMNGLPLLGGAAGNARCVDSANQDVVLGTAGEFAGIELERKDVDAVPVGRRPGIQWRDRLAHRGADRQHGVEREARFQQRARRRPRVGRHSTSVSTTLDLNLRSRRGAGSILGGCRPGI
jgi:CBS-domain-containing membrane protein